MQGSPSVPFSALFADTAQSFGVAWARECRKADPANRYYVVER